MIEVESDSASLSDDQSANVPVQSSSQNTEVLKPKKKRKRAKKKRVRSAVELALEEALSLPKRAKRTTAPVIEFSKKIVAFRRSVYWTKKEYQFIGIVFSLIKFEADSAENQTRNAEPKFYRENPQSLERLRPWVKRELLAVLALDQTKDQDVLIRYTQYVLNCKS